MSWTAMRCSACDAVTPCEHFPDLITWLCAQLDDDERVALDFGGACWHVEYCDDLGTAFHDSWDQKRVLAEIEAKRRILSEHMPRADGYCCPVCWDGAEAGEAITAPCPTVRLLAMPCAEREGYREEWRP